MKTSFLKTASTHTSDVIDSETGEIIETSISSTTYLANTKDEFFLMYSSMIIVLKDSTDVRMKLFAALIERYGNGQEFCINKNLKEIIAAECKCSPRSFDTALTNLVKHNILVKIGHGTYMINPRHVFKGSSFNRNASLKAVLTLYCPTC